MIKSREGEKFAVLEVPSEQLGRFIEIPRQKGRRKGTVYITLDNVIRACLPQVFRGVFTISSVKAYCFKFSRDAELELDPSINESLIEKMASSLKQRRKADAVRFVYDRTMPEALLSALRKSFGFGRYDSMISGGRYHNSKDFLSFPNPGGKALEYRPHPPINIPEIEPVLVYSRQDKVKERNREYYKKNRDKWKQYNENKKEKQKKMRTVIEFY